jgi:hypothetical protein
MIGMLCAAAVALEAAILEACAALSVGRATCRLFQPGHASLERSRFRRDGNCVDFGEHHRDG